MKSLVFDSSSIITLASNNLLWLLKPLRKQFGGKFFIPHSVKIELVDNALKTKRFRLEAMQVMEEIAKENLVIYSDQEVKELARKLLKLANRVYIAKGNYIKIVHLGEMEVISLVCRLNSEACVIDERTTRILIEDPEKLADLLERKLHTKVQMDRENLEEFKRKLTKFGIIRTSELVTIAYELGLLDVYSSDMEKIYTKATKEDVLDGALWGVKLRGCSISGSEIEEIKKFEREKTS